MAKLRAWIRGGSQLGNVGDGRVRQIGQTCMAYENYPKTSQNFDLTRRPIGVEILLGCFAMLGRPLSELVVLDAG